METEEFQERVDEGDEWVLYYPVTDTTREVEVLSTRKGGAYVRALNGEHEGERMNVRRTNFKKPVSE